MFGSVQCAALWRGWAEAIQSWVITLGDQPHLQNSTLVSLLRLAALNPERVCQPRYRSRWRHPVVMPKTVFNQLRLSKAATLQEFLVGCDRMSFESEDPGLDYDIDTPADYQSALARAKLSDIQGSGN